MNLTREDIIGRIRGSLGVGEGEAKAYLETLLEMIKTSLEEGGEVKISKFGRWGVREKRGRNGRNPRTGESLALAARRVVVFHPSEALKQRLNGSQEGRDRR